MQEKKIYYLYLNNNKKVGARYITIFPNNKNAEYITTLGVIVDGQIRDVISGKIIYESVNQMPPIRGLSYFKKEEVDGLRTSDLIKTLSSYSEVQLLEYIKELNKIEQRGLEVYNNYYELLDTINEVQEKVRKLQMGENNGK